MNIFTTRSKSEKLRKAFFSAFLIVSLVLSQAALPLTLAYAQQNESSEEQALSNQNQNDHEEQARGNDHDDDDDDDEDDDNDNKVNICHATSSQNNPWSAQQVSSSALATHLGHGDFQYNGPLKQNGKPANDGDEWCKNHVPTPPPAQTGTVTVFKYTTGGDGAFVFNGLGNSVSVATSSGTGSSAAISLPASETGTTYTVTEVSQNGWELTSAYCFGGDIVVGKTVEQLSDSSQSQVVSGATTTLYPGESKSCVFLNRKIPEPLQCNPEVNLIENGDFEAPALSSGTWDIIPSSNTLLKWLVAFISPSVGRLGLEIQNNVAGNSAVGSQHAELDGDNPVTIWQDIPTIAGKQYTLSFKYSPRPGVSQADNAIQPKVDGSALGAVVSADGSTNSNTVWATITRTFIGTGSPMKVELADAGSDTSLGGYLDDVKLNCGEPLPPPPQCNANASSTIVSDATTLVNGNPAAVLSFIHSGWTAVIPGATWIWATNPVESPTNDADLTKVFTKTFTIVGTPTGGSLEIAADNNYSVKVNGTTVPVTFDQNNFQLGTQDTYNVLPLLVSGSNTLEFTVTNWEIGQNADPAANPAGLLYKLSLTNDECVVPPPPVQTSTVTMCKEDFNNPHLPDDGDYVAMSGWTLTLKGSEVQNGLSVPSNLSTGVTTDPLVAGASYVAEVVGTWLNQGGANPVDAEYSTTDAWANQMDGYTGYQSDILELQIDNKFDPNSNWGAYNSLHKYAQSFVPTGASSNFRVFDGSGVTQNEAWFGDNSGSLLVNISKGYAGITGNDGCVEFDNVPYGSYTAGEIMQDGWEHVSGVGPVVVNDVTERFVIKNRLTLPPGGPTMVKVHIYKYLKNGELTAQVPNDSTAPAFPMNSLWSAENIGTASGAYVLGNYEGQGVLKYAADTSNMSAPADYTTEEVTDGSVVVPTNSESCPAGKYRLLGYKSGTSLNAAEAAVLSPTAPIFTDISVDQYVIVVNEKCPDVLGETATNSTTVVTPSSMAGWLFFPENTNSGQIGQMVTGPTGQPAGTGSAEFVLTANNQGEVLGMWDYKGTRLDKITSLAYSTFTPTAGVALPALQFEFDNDRTDADNAFKGRLVYEPYYTHTVSTGVWQTWNPMDNSESAGNGNWWFSNGTIATNSGCSISTPCTWAEILAIYPNAGLRDNGAFTGTTLFKAGSGSIFTANVDKFIIGIKTGLNTHTETFDFEPNAPEVCAAGSYTDTSDNSGAIRFENSQGYNTGSINGVNGWSATGAYDYGVVANTFGYSSFNDQAFRISNGITSGSFGDWAFATPNTNGAGESSATAGAFSVGTLQNHFEAQFDIASTRPCAQQEGLRFSVSPDRGDGSRMSYLRFEDSAGGLDVFFDDVTGTDDASINFNETQIANDLDRSIPHKVKFVMDFVDGPSNDVVKIYIDGTLVHTGTSWENYYRYDNEASAEQSPRIVKTLIFQARGTAVPANTGKGYLVDNLTLSSSTPVPAPQGGGGGGGGGTGSRSLGGGAPASTGSVLGASTSCGIYLDDFLKMGWKNRVEQVKKLQTFLNDYLKLSPKLPVNGMFGMQTFKAVVKFQEQESDLVLQPWVGVTLKDAKKGTGFVYKTTITRINNIMCPDLNLATPPAVID